MEGNPLYPQLPGPSGREGMPEANDSAALCKQADRQGKKARSTKGQFSQDAVKHPLSVTCHFSCKKGQEQRRRYPRWTRTRLLLYRRLYADTTKRGWAFPVIRHWPRTRPFGTCLASFFSAGSWSRVKAKLGSALEERFALNTFPIPKKNTRNKTHMGRPSKHFSLLCKDRNKQIS